MSNDQAKKDYLKWMQQNEPFIYEVAMQRLRNENSNLSGWADFGASIGKAFSTVTNTVSNLAPTYLQYKQQKKVMDMQMRRAEQGLPPANVEDYTPAVKVRVDASPETQQAIQTAAVQATQTGIDKMMPVFLLGGVGIIAMLMLKKKGRR